MPDSAPQCRRLRSSAQTTPETDTRYRQGRPHLVLTAADAGEAARAGPAGGGGRTWHAERA